MKRLLSALLLLSMLCLCACGESTQQRNAGWLGDIEAVEQKLLLHPMFKLGFYASITDEAESARAQQLQTDLMAQIAGACAELRNNVPTLTDLEIQRELMRIVALISSDTVYKDGHTTLWPSEKSQRVFPIALSYFGDSYYLVSYYEGAKYAEKAALVKLLGSKLLSVNGFTVAEIESLVAKHFNHDNAELLKLYTLGFIRVKTCLDIIGVTDDNRKGTLFVFEDFEGERHELTIKYTTKPVNAEGKSVYDTFVNARSKDIPLPLASQTLSKPYAFRHLEEEGAYYVQITTCELELEQMSFRPQLEKALAHCAQDDCCKKLIFDLRNNGGGYTSFPVHVSDLVVRYITPGDTVGFYVLINRGSYSAAVIMAQRLKEKSGAILVGEPTSGGEDLYSTPEPGYYETLPYSKMQLCVASGVYIKGKYPLFFLGAMDTSPLEPDVYIPTTIEEYVNNEDTPLSWVLAQ